MDLTADIEDGSILNDFWIVLQLLGFLFLYYWFSAFLIFYFFETILSNLSLLCMGLESSDRFQYGEDDYPLEELGDNEDLGGYTIFMDSDF